ncbi:DUF6443 domain-containing protein [Winogradskyella sp.]|uniref:DUF6443 domain-containing protein n=1 Tax=Winogradskyella sp. TaxID=1883156 RepID=UPI003AA7F71A
MKKNLLLIIVSLFFSGILFSQTIPTPIGTDEDSIWYRDADGDGLGNPLITYRSATRPNGFVFNNLDCDDSDPNATSEQVWYKDNDGDGLGNPNNKIYSCRKPTGYTSKGGDCNDSNPSLPRYYYRDNDGDGYGSKTNKVLDCSVPLGYVSNFSDCNDSDASLPKYWYRDADNDGFGDGGERVLACEKPFFTDPLGEPFYYSEKKGDCNDNNPNIKPGALEICDGVDNNCDGQIDETKPDIPSIPTIKKNCGNTVLTKGTSPDGITWYWQSSNSGTSMLNSSTSVTRTSGTVYYLRAYNTSTKCWSNVRSISYTINIPSILYADQDGDGYGDANNTISTCETPSGYVSNNNDYDDSTTNITNIAPQTFYLDADNDGFGDPNNSVYYSVKPAGYTTNNDDYDDSTVNITNIAPQTFYLDADGDGFGNPNNSVYYSVKPTGYTTNNDDYDDSTVNITNIAPQRFYLDTDGDGFGDPNNSVYYSVKPAGYVTNNTDNCPNEAGTNNGCSYVPSVFSNENYVFTREYQEPIKSSTGITQNKDVQESIIYFDGLGRAKQGIAIQAGGILRNNETPKDIVTHIEYDEFGRQTKEYLPYAVETANGVIITGDVATATKNYYQVKHSGDFIDVTLPDINAYSDKQFDDSPFNRVLKQAAPGKDWKLDNGHEIEFVYDTNIATEVKNYYVTTALADNTYVPTLELSTVNNGNYTAGKLFKTITKDENHDGSSSKLHIIEEFKNKQGQVILKRTFALVEAVETPHDTYYVYDDFGNLTYVLPPMINASTNTLAVIKSKLDDLGYQYVYDNKNRLVEKKIPGKGWEYIVYDKLDRPVLTQDALMRKSNNLDLSYDRWLITKYDILGRVAYTGYTENNGTRPYLQNMVITGNYTQFETITSKQTYGGADIYYTKSAIPNAVTGVYTINYYDTYIDLPDGLGQTVTTSYGITSTSQTKGLPTVTKTKVLETSNWVTTVTYYDKKARPIYVYSKNDELGTIDIVESKLDFSGKVLETKTTHIKGTNAPIVTVDRFEYDHMNRLINQTQQTNNQVSERLFKNIYDELGQLEAKFTGNGTKAGYDDIEGISVSGNIITKTSSNGYGNSGLITNGSILGNGYVEYEIFEPSIRYLIGLSVTNTNAHFNTIDYCIYNSPSGGLHVYELGTHKGGFGTYKKGDIFRVERINNKIHYKKNGKTFYISQTPSSGKLIGDMSIHDNGNKIKNFKIVDNSKGLQSIDYAYNVGGWIKKINDDDENDKDLFNFSIAYNDPTDPLKALYNGNVSQTNWNTLSVNNTSNPVSTQYEYIYDAMNRITVAIDNTGEYNVGNIMPITYDLNGNIRNMQRKRVIDADDNFTYNYLKDGIYTNQLQNLSGSKTGSFTYDVNGNMKTDTRKGITNITYNHLNLPVGVTLAGGTIKYTYDASGNKLRKVANNTTDYAGNFVYKNGELQFFNHPEGYVSPKDANDLTKGFDYVYQYKDHLGNVRLSYTDSNNDGIITPSTEIIEESNYYPFGLKHKGYNGNISSIGNSVAQKFGFGGKELNQELGLEWMDFGARNYDAALGRWMSLDPLAEKMRSYSPFNYAFNNPIFFIDPDGMAPKGPGDPVTHQIKKGETLSDISKRYGVTMSDLQRLNHIKEIDKIYAGQYLKVNPEMDFTDNPYGGYRNPNNSVGNVVNLDDIYKVGSDFVFGKGNENTVIAGGKALDDIKKWAPVEERIWNGIYDIFRDGKVEPGERYVYSYSPGNIKNWLKNNWNKPSNWNSPVHVIGSMSISVRVNADGESITISVYDSKTLKSLSDNKVSGKNNKIRTNDGSSNSLKNTYQRYMWSRSLPSKKHTAVWQYLSNIGRENN